MNCNCECICKFGFAHGVFGFADCVVVDFDCVVVWTLHPVFRGFFVILGIIGRS